METNHEIHSIRFEGDNLIVVVDNKEIKIALSQVSPRLSQASDEVRNDFNISPSGYGIHWRGLDEDLSINGLIEKSKKNAR